jgi:hypothetical protein
LTVIGYITPSFAHNTHGARIISFSFGGGAMSQGESVEALLYIRKLRGGSQPILVKANDGFFYVVKFLNNLQGTQSLFNEAVGTELFGRAGLPVPEWRPVHITEDFLDRNPWCWMETENGRRRPKAGWCFGSRFLGLKNVTLFEILPSSSFSRIVNRTDFLTAWVLDAFCGHADNRQAVFMERKSRWLDAHFIDHGHLFGGALGVETPSFLTSRYLDPRIYAHASSEDADGIQRAIQGLDLTALSNVACGLPEGWSTDRAMMNFERFTRLVSDSVLLKNVIQFILGTVEHTEEGHDSCLAQYAVRYKRKSVRTQILPSGVDDRAGDGASSFVGNEKRRGPQAVRASYAYAANFG